MGIGRGLGDRAVGHQLAVDVRSCGSHLNRVIGHSDYPFEGVLQQHQGVARQRLTGDAVEPDGLEASAPAENVVLELKAISGELGASEEQQLRNYLRILRINRGLLVNFQQPGKKPGKTRLDIREVTITGAGNLQS